MPSGESPPLRLEAPAPTLRPRYCAAGVPTSSLSGIEEAAPSSHP
jgi:hypothetical protein